MGNALGIPPSVMINRIADREGATMAASLGKVAELQGALRIAQDNEQAAAAGNNPDGDAPRPIISSGHDVDRLI
nr:hypothetical protein [uncultured Devosia sp.]